VTSGNASKIRTARPIRAPKWPSGQELAGQPQQGTLQTRPCARAGVITQIPERAQRQDAGAPVHTPSLHAATDAESDAAAIAAITTPGPQPTVIRATGALEALDPDQLDAVLVRERAQRGAG